MDLRISVAPQAKYDAMLCRQVRRLANAHHEPDELCESRGIISGTDVDLDLAEPKREDRGS